ncbi:hypothetical protein [Pseudalkalibacillus decolorationis]|uniref:hypothetical protein n=1 Tax=Pseudalkalibacillus decolorationis TaxID=163879 RepID=UPI0021493B4C|nr:hypothetical protein [Pseudalkalibacillus decolorationis]
MKRLLLSMLITGLTVVLTGCLYPDERLEKNRIPYEDQLQSVEEAVINFRKDTGVLPIENRDMKTSIYIKYPIDFGKLIPRYLPEPPGNSFQNGGVFQYVLIDVEKDPKVKLVDLETVEKVKDYRMKIRLYLEKHDFVPFEDVLANKRYTLNYTKLGYEEQPFVKSPFTGNNLPLIVDEQNHVYIDYSMDLYQALQNTSHDYQKGDDIRDILMKDSMFVPAFSVPYTVKNGEPVFLIR